MPRVPRGGHTSFGSGPSNWSTATRTPTWHEVAQAGNRRLRPDATTAAILAHAAILAAAMMVQVDVGVSVSDHRLREALQLIDARR